MPLAGLWARVSNAGVVTDVLAKTAARYATTGLTGLTGITGHTGLQVLRMGGMNDRHGKDRYGMALASGPAVDRLCVRLLNKCESIDPLLRDNSTADRANYGERSSLCPRQPGESRRFRTPPG